MESEAFSARAEPFGHSTETFLIILAAMVFVIVLALVLLCLCRTRRSAPTNDLSLSAHDQTGVWTANPVELLIPPLFYTEGLRDPLMQEDLRDRVTTVQPKRP
jgi:heme/copper-type cytochrome/quinol oxidase subunit 2